MDIGQRPLRVHFGRDADVPPALRLLRSCGFGLTGELNGIAAEQKMRRQLGACSQAPLLGYDADLDGRRLLRRQGPQALLLLLTAASNAQTVQAAFVATPLPERQDDSIRTFHINVPDEQLVDLRQRLASTRWPDKETVNDESQGIRLAEIQALVHYWGTDYDWRKGEAKLNALPEFVTTIDGIDIQFIQVRENVMHYL